MDGNWNAQGATEQLRQGYLSRHRLLRVNTDAPVNVSDSSGYAKIDPNEQPPTLPVEDGGPHFIMSPEAPSGHRTHGFEWGFASTNSSGILVGEEATLAAGGIDVTVWVCITTTFFPTGVRPPVWAAFQTLVGVQPNRIYRSFDVDASVLRFQLGPTGITADGSILMFFCEL